MRRACNDGNFFVQVYMIRVCVGYTCVLVASWFQRRFRDELSEFPSGGDKGGGGGGGSRETHTGGGARCWYNRSATVELTYPESP